MCHRWCFGNFFVSSWLFWVSWGSFASLGRLFESVCSLLSDLSDFKPTQQSLDRGPLALFIIFIDFVVVYHREVLNKLMYLISNCIFCCWQHDVQKVFSIFGAVFKKWSVFKWNFAYNTHRLSAFACYLTPHSADHRGSCSRCIICGRSAAVASPLDTEAFVLCVSFTTVCGLSSVRRHSLSRVRCCLCEVMSGEMHCD